MIKHTAIFLFATALLLCGCSGAPKPENLPTYSGLDGPAAERILAARAAAIHTLSAQCELTLDRGDGGNVRLDGLMVIATPDRLRLRVWKLNQAVFDLTVRKDGLWIETSKDAARQGRVVPASLGAGQLAQFLTWFEGGFFTQPGLKVESKGATLTFRRDQPDGTAILCEVDRSTVTPRLFRLMDAAGKTRFSLAMSDYQAEGGVFWPRKLTAISAADAVEGGGKIDVNFSEIEFNGELAPTAFQPPPDAEKRP